MLSSVVRQLTIPTLKKSRGTGERGSVNVKPRRRVGLLLTRKTRRLKTVVRARKKLGVQPSAPQAAAWRPNGQNDRKKYKLHSTDLVLLRKEVVEKY